MKKGLDAGKVFILQIILGEEEGCVCQLTTWRRDMVQVQWGGYGLGSDPRRGETLSTLKVSRVHSHSVADLKFVDIVECNSPLCVSALHFVSLPRRTGHATFYRHLCHHLCSQCQLSTNNLFTPTLTLTPSPAMRPPRRAQLCYLTLPSTH